MCRYGNGEPRDPTYKSSVLRNSVFSYLIRQPISECHAFNSTILVVGKDHLTQLCAGKQDLGL